MSRPKRSALLIELHEALRMLIDIIQFLRDSLANDLVSSALTKAHRSRKNVWDEKWARFSPMLWKAQKPYDSGLTMVPPTGFEPARSPRLRDQIRHANNAKICLGRLAAARPNFGRSVGPKVIPKAATHSRGDLAAALEWKEVVKKKCPPACRSATSIQDSAT